MAYFVSSPADSAKLVDEVDNLRGLDPAVLFIGIFFRLVPKIRLVPVRYILDARDMSLCRVILVFRHITAEDAIHPNYEIDVDRGADQCVVCHTDRAVKYASDYRQLIRYRSRLHHGRF